MRTQIESDSATTSSEKETLKKIEEERQTVSASLYEQRARREELLTNARDLADRIHKQELAQSKLEMELGSMPGPYLERVRSDLRKRACLKTNEIGVGASNTP
jgi:chromosome segregation ATPase